MIPNNDAEMFLNRSFLRGICLAMLELEHEEEYPHLRLFSQRLRMHVFLRVQPHQDPAVPDQELSEHRVRIHHLKGWLQLLNMLLTLLFCHSFFGTNSPCYCRILLHLLNRLI